MKRLTKYLSCEDFNHSKIQIERQQRHFVKVHLNEGALDFIGHVLQFEFVSILILSVLKDVNKNK